jgi:hypothetical protein
VGVGARFLLIFLFVSTDGSAELGGLFNKYIMTLQKINLLIYTQDEQEDKHTLNAPSLPIDEKVASVVWKARLARVVQHW